MAFPTKIERYDGFPIPRRFFGTGYEQSNQTGTLTTTVSAINASTGLGLNIVQSNSSPNRGRDTIILGALVSASSDCLIAIYTGATAYTKVFVKAGTPHRVPMMIDQRGTGGGSVFVEKCIDADDSKAVYVTASFDIWNVPFDQKTDCKKIRYIGDSITYGFWLDFGQQYHFHLTEEIQKRKGKMYSTELIGMSGTTIKDNYISFKTGKHQYELNDVAVLVLAFGVNDVGGSSPISITDYKSYMTKVVTLLLAQNQNMVVVMMGGTPVTNATNEAQGVLYRAELAEIVTEVNNPRLFSINPTGAYVTNATNIPDGIHPSATGHQLVFDNILIPWLNSATGQSFLSVVK